MIKEYIRIILDYLKELPKEYETMKKRNEMTREKINKEYEEFKQKNK